MFWGMAASGCSQAGKRERAEPCQETQDPPELAETPASESALGPRGTVVGVELHGQKPEQQRLPNHGKPCPACAPEEARSALPCPARSAGLAAGDVNELISAIRVCLFLL